MRLTIPNQAQVPNTDANATASGFGFEQHFRVIAFIKGSPLNRLSNANEASVRFESLTKAYNIITPNHDGLNDVLVIDNVQLYAGNTFTVFNRWGREVFATTDPAAAFTGAGLSEGVYFYYLTATDCAGRPVRWRGPVTLVR